VFASSGGVLYGDVTAPAPEDTPANPVSPYGITKWVGERYLEFYAREHGLATVALRYSNVYGPRQNPHGEAGVVAIFCKRLLAGEAARINGDGRYVRDYVYGPDVARANLVSLTADLPQVAPGTLTSLNIGTGLGTDVNELEAMIRGAMQELVAARGRPAALPLPEHGSARAGDLRSNLVDAARAEHLGEALGLHDEGAHAASKAHATRATGQDAARFSAAILRFSGRWRAATVPAPCQRPRPTIAVTTPAGPP